MLASISNSTGPNALKHDFDANCQDFKNVLVQYFTADNSYHTKNIH
jgi:hypothetical protein